MQDIKSVQAFARMMKKEGIQSLKCGEIELHLSPYAIIPKPKTASKKASKSEHIPSEGYTDEEILNWSASPVGLNG